MSTRFFRLLGNTTVALSVLVGLRSVDAADQPLGQGTDIRLPKVVRANLQLGKIFAKGSVVRDIRGATAWSAKDGAFQYAAVNASGALRSEARTLCRAALVRGLYPADKLDVSASSRAGRIYRQVVYRSWSKRVHMSGTQFVAEDNTNDTRATVCRIKADNIESLTQGQNQKLRGRSAYRAAKQLVAGGSPKAALELLGIARQSPDVRDNAIALSIPLLHNVDKNSVRLSVQNDLNLDQVTDPEALTLVGNDQLRWKHWSSARRIFSRCLAIAESYTSCHEGMKIAAQRSERNARQRAFDYQQMVQ